MSTKIHHLVDGRGLPLVVLVGSLRRLPTIPVLGAAILLASVLAVLIQPFSLDVVATSLTTGFDPATAVPHAELPPAVVELVQRGGLYSCLLYTSDAADEL